MQLSIYQIIICIISCIFIVDRVIKYLKREYRQSFLKVSVLIFIWLLVILSTLFPNFLKQTLIFFNLDDNNALVFISFLILYILFFKLLGIVEKIEREITEIVRKEALRDIKHK